MGSEFQTALESGDIAVVRRCPKADLHTHGSANCDRQYVFEKTGRDIAPIVTPLESMDEMHDWARANIGALFDGAAGRELWLEASCVRARLDGLCRLEFGDDVWMVTQGLGSPQELVDSIARVHARMDWNNGRDVAVGSV